MFEAMERFTDMTGQLDKVSRVSSSLLRQGARTEAADLVSVLQEVEKTLTAVELVLIQFLSLRFDAKREDDESSLVRLQGEAPAKLIGEMRARCRKIGDIYWNSLQDWFARSDISDQDRADLQALFLAIDDSDSNVIVPAVAEVIDWLEKNADSVAESVHGEDYETAKQRVRAAQQEAAPIRRTMGRVASNLRELELQFTPTSPRARGTDSRRRD